MQSSNHFTQAQWFQGNKKGLYKGSVSLSVISFISLTSDLDKSLFNILKYVSEKFTSTIIYNKTVIIPC